MSDTGDRRRSEDSPLRVWAPILVPAITIAVAWGAMDSKLSTLTDNQNVLVSDVRDLRDNKARAEVILSSMTREIDTAKSSAAVINDISQQVGTLEEKVRTIEGNMNQVWPRLRALDKNVTILARELSKLDPNINIVLEEPQPF